MIAHDGWDSGIASCLANRNDPLTSTPPLLFVDTLGYWSEFAGDRFLFQDVKRPSPRMVQRYEWFEVAFLGHHTFAL